MRKEDLHNLLNVLFMLGAVATVLIYFAAPREGHAWIYVGGASLLLKIADYVLRALRK